MSVAMVMIPSQDLSNSIRPGKIIFLVLKNHLQNESMGL
jgi:hypothetical protein